MVRSPSFQTLTVTIAIVALSAVLAHPSTALGAPVTLVSSPRDGTLELVERAKHQIGQGKFKTALRSLGIVIRKNPKAAEAYFLRAAAYDRMGLPQSALKDVDRFVDLRPSDPKGYIRRGDIKNFNMQHEQALVDYDKATRLAPSSPSGYLGRGLAHAALGKYDEAIKDYLWVLRLDPDNREVLTNLGIACMLAGKSIQAMTYFEKALSAETNPRWRRQIQEWMSRILKESEAARSRKSGPTRFPVERARPMW